jgi:hypothetical protein
MAEIVAAEKAAAAKITESAVQAQTIQSQIQQAHGQEKVIKEAQNAKPNPLSSAENKSSNLKSTEGGLALDVGLQALDSSSGGAIGFAKDAYDIFADMDPGSFGGMSTMENFCQTGTKGQIKTDYFNDLSFRADAAGMFSKEPGKTSSWSDVKSCTAQLTNKLTMTGLTKERDVKLAAEARYAQQIKGGELQRTMQMGGAGSKLRVATLEKELNGPKGPSKSIMSEPVQKSDDSI